MGLESASPFAETGSRGGKRGPGPKGRPDEPKEADRHRGHLGAAGGRRGRRSSRGQLDVIARGVHGAPDDHHLLRRPRSARRKR